MKRYLFLTFAVGGMFSWVGLAFSRAAHDNSHEKNAFTPDSISWGRHPPLYVQVRSLPYSKATQPRLPATSRFV
ncbi:MAG TPA: hypothetical protein VKH63_22665 [Candidatus Acidoferrum sp.]|jgi:hypothetical protein|nr:hypothetical protein [Candidatus Acidoferrum sp.]